MNVILGRLACMMEWRGPSAFGLGVNYDRGVLHVYLGLGQLTFIVVHDDDCECSRCLPF